MNPSDFEAQVLAVLRDSGLLVEAVVWDHEIHRCPTADKPGKKNGAYVAREDAPASVWWLNWGTGEE